MMKHILLELLTAYRTGKLSQEDFEKSIDELYLSASERIKNTLDNNAIFVSLSLSLSRSQVAPSERYNSEEMDLLMED